MKSNIYNVIAKGQGKMELQNEYTVMFALRMIMKLELACQSTSNMIQQQHGIGKEEGHIVIV